MKIVYTSSQDVLHLFAEQSQNNARCSNVFFEGNKVYSYGRHYLLGEILPNNAIMINNLGYSVTTSKHISQLTGATRQYKQFFTANTDLKTVLFSIEDNLKKLVNARKKEKYILPSISIFASLNEYIEFSGKKELKKTIEYKKIVKLMKVVNSDNLSDYLQKESVRIKKEATKRKKEDVKKLAIQLQKFEDYEVSSIYGIEEDFVRLSKCGEFVETSQNVRVTTKEASLLYNMIMNGKDIKGFKISNYTVISLNGTLQIGCHKININSMHKIGKKL